MQLPVARTHWAGVNVPPPFEAKETIPVGMTAVPVPESVTVAVHAMLTPGATMLGVQVTATVTGLGFTWTLVVPVDQA